MVLFLWDFTNILLTNLILPVINKYTNLLSDPMMDSSERISKLQSNLEELRKTYMTLRSKLTSIERRRKKIRKREREKSDNPSGPEVEAAA